MGGEATTGWAGADSGATYHGDSFFKGATTTAAGATGKRESAGLPTSPKTYSEPGWANQMGVGNGGEG